MESNVVVLDCGHEVDSNATVNRVNCKHCDGEKYFRKDWSQEGEGDLKGYQLRRWIELRDRNIRNIYA